MSDKKQMPKVPDHVIESFARCILPGIRKYFDSEERQREFAKWKGTNKDKKDNGSF